MAVDLYHLCCVLALCIPVLSKDLCWEVGALGSVSSAEGAMYVSSNEQGIVIPHICIVDLYLAFFPLC